MTSRSETIQLFLRKTFDIRPGELFRASLMQLYIFLIITTLLIVKPTVNSLFLSKFGVEKLPYAFILVAIVAALVTTIYASIVRRIPLNKIIQGTLWASVASLLIFGGLLRFNIAESLVLFVFYIWVAIFALLATSQFWVLANVVLNAREAKRLFGFIGAGAIAGGIFGGYLTSVLAQFMSSENLPFWGAATIAACLPINRIIWKKYVEKTQSTFQQQKRTIGFGDHPFNLVRKSAHLTYLASIVGVSVMVAKLVDYQFGGIAAELIPDPDELTSFFGFWMSTFSVISLAMQLFVTRRVVGTFGVGSSLLFLPLTIFIAVMALLFFPGLLAAAVFLKMADAGLKQSINKAAMELLILPIPVALKNQTKTFIDVFVDSLATGISGLILIFLIQGLSLSTNAINAMIIGLLTLWLFLISKVKKEYLRSFRRKIDPPKNHHREKELDISQDSVINGLKKVLQKGASYQQLTILRKINGLNHPTLFSPTCQLLDNPGDDIKLEAIRNLYYYKNPNYSREMERYIQHDNAEIKIAAFEYLIKHAGENRIAMMEKFINQDDYSIRGAALVSIAKETRDNPKLIRQFNIPDRIQGKLDLLPKIKDPEEFENRTLTALEIIGQANIPLFFPFIQNCFGHANLRIAKKAVQQAGQTLSPEFINPLLQLLSRPLLKKAAGEALINYGNGLVPVLSAMVKKGQVDRNIQRLIPGVVKKIAAQRSVNFLFLLMSADDFVVRQESLRGLNYLRNHFSHLKFNAKKVNQNVIAQADTYRHTVAIFHAQKKIMQQQPEQMDTELGEARQGLVHLLDKKLRLNLEHIFRLLGLNHSNGDIYVIYKGIRSRKKDLRLNALEFLDNLLRPKIKKAVVPLVELSMQEQLDDASRKTLQLVLPEDLECMQLLLAGKDTRLKQATLYLAAQLNEPAFAELIRAQTHSSDLRVKDYALRLEKEYLSVS